MTEILLGVSSIAGEVIALESETNELEVELTVVGSMGEDAPVEEG